MYHSVEHSPGRAQANGAGDQAPKTTTPCGCSLGAAVAMRRTPVDFEYSSMMRRLMDIAECWQVYE
jgi:hypothetical protein